MRYIINILILGVLFVVLTPEQSEAQRIEYTEDGRAFACTDYTQHEKDNRKVRVGRVLAYAAIAVTTVLVINATSNNNDFGQSVNHLSQQSMYALGAVVGATLVVSLYKFDVKMKNKAGL